MNRIRRPSAHALLLLDALSKRPRAWQHGYELSQITGLKSGTLYPILSRLEDRGYLESKWLEPAPGGRPPRHVCRLTSVGAAYAREHVSHREPAHLLSRQDSIKT